MKNLIINPIGKISICNGEKVISLDPKYISATKGLDGFSHIQVIWWFDKCDNENSRNILLNNKPYKKGPEILGTFATRSPERPNPIAITASYVTYIHHEQGIIGLAYIDADEGTPIIDIKPYTPSLDRIDNPGVPDWCSHWPKSNEESEDFNWEDEFNFNAE